MREARVVRLLREQRFQDRERLQPARVRFVVQIFGRRERQGIENFRFGILWIPLRDFSHRVPIGLDASLLRALRVRVEIRDRVDVGPLASGLRTDGAAALDCREPLLQLRRRPNTDRKRVRPAAERDPPLGHRA